MEKVLIVNRSGNVYFDQRGRPLRTMGDINVSVGQWVWTNGTTIYGHQAAGYTPPAVGGGFNGVPIWDPPYQKLIHIKKSGDIADLVDSLYYNWRFFVNNKVHFYSTDYSGKIYNLKTGQFVSGPQGDMLDAEVSSDGSLYQIMNGNYAETNDPKQTLTKYLVDYESNGKNSGYYDWKLKYTDYEIGSGVVTKTANPIKIYKGTTVVKEIDLASDVFGSTMLSEIENYTSQYSGEEAGGELIDSDRIPPEAFNKTWGVNIISGKIWPDGKYEILATAYAYRVFFPWCSYQFDEFQYTSNPPNLSKEDPISPDSVNSRKIKGYYIAVANITNMMSIKGDVDGGQSVSIIRSAKNIASYFVRFPSRYIKFVFTDDKVPPGSALIAGAGDSKLLEVAGTTNSTEQSDHGWYQYDVVPSLSTYMGESLQTYYPMPSNYTRLTTQWRAMGASSTINNDISGDNDITIPIQDNAYAIYHSDTGKSDIYDGDGINILSGFDKINPTSKVSLCNIGKTYFLGVMGSLYKIENGSYTDTGIMQYNTRLRKGNLSLLKKGIKKLS